MPRTRDTNPRVTSTHCNSCGRITNHKSLAKKVTPIAPEWVDFGSHFWEDDDGTTTSEILQCQGCGTLCYRSTVDLDSADHPDVIQYPPPVFRRRPSWSAGSPPQIQELMEELYRALAANSPRLAMMGARTLIDLVLQERVGDQGGFKERLGRLEQIGAIGKEHADVLSKALEAGHASSHRGYLPTVEDLNGVMDIVEHLLQATYVLPKTAEEVAKRTPGRPSRPDKQPANVVSINRAKER